MARLLSSPIEYKPGEKVPTSGIYEVTHDQQHHTEHEVTCVKGDIFPPCRGCDHPRYKLVHAAHHLSEDTHLGQRLRRSGLFDTRMS